MNGFLKFQSVRERDASWSKILEFDPKLGERCVRSASLPQIVLSNVDPDTVEKIIELTNGVWVADVQFHAFS